MNFEKINKLIFKFQNLGIEKSNDGAILIGKAPHKGPKAWVNLLFPPLSIKEINDLKIQLNRDIPKEYTDFLLNFSNGLDVLSSTFSLYGLRRQLNRDIETNVRQPYSIITPNIFERPDNAKDSCFFIGGYNWDGSHLYIDNETNIIHCCQRWDATSKKQWNSLEEMILSEIERLYNFFDDKGIEFDENKKIIPY